MKLKAIFDALHRFRWPLVAVLITASVLYVVVVGFGETLGVDASVRDVMKRAASWAWNTAVTLLVPVLLRDAGGNGTPDILDAKPEVAS